MKLSPWLTVVAVTLCLFQLKVQGESYIERLNVPEGRRGAVLQLFGFRRSINIETSNREETSKCDNRTSEVLAYTGTMTTTPYMTLALKVLLMVILSYTL